MWPAIIAGAASLAGGLLSNNASAYQSQKARDFAAFLSSTAHLREVNDLKAAGLNPILSGSGGMGASTPSLPAAPQSDVLTPAIHSALAAYNAGIDSELKKSTAFKQGVESAKIKEDTLNAREENLNIQKERLKIIQDTVTAKALQFKLSRESELVSHNIQKTDADRSVSEQMADYVNQQKISEKLKQQILDYDIVSSQAAAKRALTEKEIDETQYGRIMRYIDRLTKSASPMIPSTSYKIK